MDFETFVRSKAGVASTHHLEHSKFAPNSVKIVSSIRHYFKHIS